MVYIPQTWNDSSSGGTPITAARLAHLEAGVAAAIGGATVSNSFDPMSYGAIGDGASHPLSTRYATLAAAQAVYPKAGALTDEIDGCAIQRASDAASAAGGGVVSIVDTYTFNQNITFLKFVNVRGNGSGDASGSSVSNSRLVATGGGAQVQFGSGTSANERGGLTGGFVVDGANVGGTSAGGLWFENFATQRTFIDITVRDSAGDGCVRYYGQNNFYAGFDVHRSAGNNRVWDFGTGGHKSVRCESSKAGGYHDWFKGGTGGPYTVPSHITFDHCLNERANGTTTTTNGMVRLDAGDRVKYTDCIFAIGATSTVSPADSMVQAVSGDLVLQDCTVSGNGVAAGIRQETAATITVEGRHQWRDVTTGWTRNGGTARLFGTEDVPSGRAGFTRWGGTLGGSGFSRNGNIQVTKAADETRNNTATLAADGALSVPLEANAEYVFRGYIKYVATITADLKVSFAAPTGATYDWVALGLGVGTGTTVTTGSVNMASNPGSGNNRPMGGADAATELVLTPSGRVVTTGTVGSLTFQWAQNTAEVSDAIVKAGSYLTLTRVA